MGFFGVGFNYDEQKSEAGTKIGAGLR